MAETMVLGGGGVESERRMGERNPLRALPRTSRREVRPGHNRGLRTMRLIINDCEGVANAITQCIGYHGMSAYSVLAGRHSPYTAVMEVWYV